MSDEHARVHSITVVGLGADALLTCRYCGTTAASVIALARIPCLFTVAVGVP